VALLAPGSSPLPASVLCRLCHALGHSRVCPGLVGDLLLFIFSQFPCSCSAGKGQGWVVLGLI